MAHLRGITRTCGASGCTSTATKEVYSNRNDPCGAYCNRHAKRALRARQENEDCWAREEQERFDARTREVAKELRGG